MSHLPQDSAWQRAPRPLIGWMGVLLVCVCVLTVAAIFAAIAVGFWMTAARGETVPNFEGGLSILIPALATAGAAVFQYMQNRSRERRDSIAFGVPPAPFPSAPSSPPEEEPSVNPHGGPGAP